MEVDVHGPLWGENLRCAGHVLDKYMPLAKQSYQDEIDYIPFAYNHFADVRNELIGCLFDLRYVGVIFFVLCIQ